MTSIAPSSRGRFITIEGPDGSGKTTIAARLHQRLQAAGIDALLTREPGGTPLGDRIRHILLDVGEDHDHLDAATEALLFSAARARHVREVIHPALEVGRTVVCARYADSTIAYQGHGGGLPLDELRVVGRLATAGLVPDLTILLDIPVDVGLDRKSAEITRFELGYDAAYHARVRAGFLSMAAAEPARWVTVDAQAPEHEVLAAAVAACGRFPEIAGAIG